MYIIGFSIAMFDYQKVANRTITVFTVEIDSFIGQSQGNW